MHALLLLRNAVAAVSLQDDALHNHHMLLNHMKVIFKLCIRTRITYNSISSSAFTDMNILGDILHGLFREVWREHVNAAFIREGDATIAEGAIEIAEELVVLSHRSKRQSKQLYQSSSLLRVFGTLG